MTAKEQRAKQQPEQETPEGETGPTAGNGAGESPRDQAAPDEAAPEDTGELAPEDAVSDLQAQVADLEDRLKRAVAETENVRRRAERDRQDAMKYGAAGVMKDILNASDNLRRAIESVPAEQAEGNEAVKNLLSGVEMTERELLTALERHGVQPIAARPGDRFDPHRHEAMFEVPTDEQAPGTIVHILQTGYTLHDRLLRPTRVGVAKATGEQANGGQNVDTSA